MTNPNEETTNKQHRLVRVRAETHETLQLIKEKQGWTGTEALKRIVNDFARRHRIAPKHEESVAGA
jgi:hypothetical protein